MKQLIQLVATAPKADRGSIWIAQLPWKYWGKLRVCTLHLTQPWGWSKLSLYFEGPTTYPVPLSLNFTVCKSFQSTESGTEKKAHTVGLDFKSPAFYQLRAVRFNPTQDFRDSQDQTKLDPSGSVGFTKLQGIRTWLLILCSFPCTVVISCMNVPSVFTFFRTGHQIFAYSI